MKNLILYLVHALMQIKNCKQTNYKWSVCVDVNKVQPLKGLPCSEIIEGVDDFGFHASQNWVFLI